MTKKINLADLTFKISDDGTLKAVGNEAQKTSKKLDKTGKSTRDVNRNMQAMSGRVESGTKGFARMQQGTGGLVQSYAILASTLFAVGAAFRVLQNAANVENQIKGFRALGEITGESMMGVTAAVRAATGGLLNFQDAAQQASIGMAAGFTQDQLAGLAEGAKLASVTLGRDLTDSFNRLIRGVTKAEPELLDELGIILRLDIATRKFANANGLIAEKLTISQRRAAVFEEVQRQLIANFGAMEDEADKLLNPFDRLATRISDFFIQIQGPFVNFFGGIADFISNNFGALITLVTAFSLSILKQIVPSFQQMGASAVTAGNAAKKKLGMLDKDIKTQSAGIRKIEKQFGASEIKRSKLFNAELKRRGISIKKFTAMSIREQKKLVRQMIADEKKGLTHTKASNKKREAAYRAAFNKIERQSKKTTKTVAAHFKIMGLQIQGVFTRVQVRAQGALVAIGNAAARLAPVFATLGAIVNIAFGILMAFFTAKFLVDLLPVTKRINAALDDIRERGKALNETMTDLAHTFAGGLAEKRIQRIKEEFEGLEGVVMAANFQMERLDNILNRGQSGSAFIEDIEESLRTNFAMGEGTSVMGSIVGGLLGQNVGAKGFESEAYRKEVKNIIMQLQSMALKEMQGYKAMGPEAFDELGFFGFEQLFNVSGGFDADSEKAFEKFKKEFNAIMAIGNETTRQTALATLLQDTATQLSDTYDEGSAFLTITKEGNLILTDVAIGLIEHSEHTLKNFTAVTSVLGNTKEAAKSLKENLQNMMPKPSQAEQVMSSIGTLLDQFTTFDEESGKRQLKQFDLALDEKDQKVSLVQELNKILGLNLEITELGKVDAENAVKILEAEMKRLDIADMLIDTHQMVVNLIKAEENRLKFINTRMSKRFTTETKIALLKEQQVNNLAKAEVKSADELVKLLGEVEENRKRELETVKTTNIELQSQIDLLQAGLDRTLMLKKELIETFDKVGASELQKLLETGDLSEFGGKEFALGLATSLRKTVAKSLSESMIDPITDKLQSALGFGKEKEKSVHELIGEKHNKHVNDLANVLNQHVQAIAAIEGVTPTTINSPTGGGTGGAGSGSGAGGEETTEEKVKSGITGGIEEVVASDVSTDPTGLSAIFGDVGGIFDVFLGDLKGIFKGEEGAFGDLFANLKAGIFGDGTEDGKGIFGNFFSTFMGEGGPLKAITNMFGGGGLGAMFGGTSGAGIGGMLGGLFGSGGGLTGLLKPLLGMIPGIGPLLSFLPFERGGIIELAKGGMMPRYASGGIATQPTYLVGEGKQNEAVVPLPDNRSIPVNMKGNAATNNTNINVNIDGNGNASADITSDGAAQLGEAINLSVMETLIKEQRPGGLLNP